MSACTTLVPDGPFVRSMLGYIDCQAQTIGESGYAALAVPGSSAGLVLTGALTIFIALFGYRMILGEIPGIRDSLLAIIKVGIVLTLATSWSAFRPLVYDVAVKGPAALTADIGGPSALPGAGGGLVDWLQAVDDSLVQLGIIGTGPPQGQLAPVPAPSPLPSAQTPSPQPQLLPQLQRRAWDPVRDTALIDNARTLYLTSAIGALAAVQLIAGLLLALGPFFVIGLFFDATRGLFVGWVRGLIGVTLAATSTAIILGVELALLGPWLANVLASRNAEISTPSVPVELFVVTLVFAVVLLAGLIASAIVARGFSLAPALRLVAPQLPAVPVGDARSSPFGMPTATPPSEGERSRALAIADAARAAQQRDDRVAQGMSLSGDPRRTSVVANVRSADMTTGTPLGSSFARRVNGRVSAGAGRRDQRT
ncbi:MAG: type IV secretion system protein [Sphingomonas sp.]